MGGGGACLRPVMRTMIARTMTMAVNPMMTRVSMPMAESPLVLLFPSPSFSSTKMEMVSDGLRTGMTMIPPYTPMLQKLGTDTTKIATT